MELNKKTVRTLMVLITFAVVLNATVHNLPAIGGALDALLGIASPLLFGLALAFTLNIPMTLLENKVFCVRDKRGAKWKQKLRRPLSLLISVLVVLIIVVSVSLIVIPRLITTITGLMRQMPLWVESLKVQLQQFEDEAPELIGWIEAFNIDWPSIEASVLSFLRQGVGSVLSNAVTVATSVFGSATSAALAIIFALSALCRKERLAAQCKALVRAYLKPDYAERVIEVTQMTSRAFFGFITGQILEAMILGVLCFLGMLLFRFPQAFLISTMVCVTAVIPIFGALISAVVGALLIMVTSSLGQGVGFIVFFVVLQQIEGNVIYPRVMGNNVGLPALWVLVAITLGGGAFGVVGMLVSIPIFAVVYTLLRESVRRRNAARATPHTADEPPLAPSPELPPKASKSKKTRAHR